MTPPLTHEQALPLSAIYEFIIEQDMREFDKAMRDPELRDKVLRSHLRVVEGGRK